jgi:hypothetical protein
MIDTGGAVGYSDRILIGGHMTRPRNGRAGGILKLAADDPERELAFELAYLRRLTTQERFDLMFRKSRELVESLARHGHRRPVAVVKRA